MLAGFAGFDTDVRKLFSDVDGEFVFTLFGAMGAEDATKLPFLGAEGALQVTFAAVAFGAKHPEERKRIAARATTDGHGEIGRKHGADDEFGVRLKKGAAEEFVEWFGGVSGEFAVLREGFEQAGFPGRKEHIGPGVLTLIVEQAGLCGERAGSFGLEECKKFFKGFDERWQV